LFAVGSAAAATPHTLYVSTSGSDTNSCRADHPCRTISHAIDVAVPGTHVVVRHGEYHEQVFITKRIHLTGEHATIDGSG
jgi:pectin methylesterase-like acyl-CoA thioesterase